MALGLLPLELQVPILKQNLKRTILTWEHPQLPHMVVGEYSLLPHFHREDPDTSYGQLLAILPLLETFCEREIASYSVQILAHKNSYEPGPFLFRGLYELQTTLKTPLIPSVEFAVGSFLWNLAMAIVPRGHTSWTIPLQFLLFPGEQLTPEEANLSTHLKVKWNDSGPGMGTLEWAKDLLSRQPHSTIRLDLQGRHPANVGPLLSIIGSRLEYIESPPPQLLGQYPYGLDAELAGMTALRKSAPPSGLSALILKPNFLGLQQTIKWAHWGKQWGLTKTFSHTYESPVGAGFMIEWAYSLMPDPFTKIHLAINQHKLVNNWEQIAQRLNQLGAPQRIKLDTLANFRA